MSGNASYRLPNTAVLSVCAVEAPIVVTSAAFDERLADTYQRLGLRPGMLEQLAGVHERRWWPEDVTFADAAAMAGAKALAEAGIDPRADRPDDQHLGDPGAPGAVDRGRGAPRSSACRPRCLNFDLTNACLGFVNGMQLAGTMIDSGQIEYALMVNGEDSRPTQEATLDRLAGRTPRPRTCWRSSPP